MLLVFSSTRIVDSTLHAFYCFFLSTSVGSSSRVSRLRRVAHSRQSRKRRHSSSQQVFWSTSFDFRLQQHLKSTFGSPLVSISIFSRFFDAFFRICSVSSARRTHQRSPFELSGPARPFAISYISFHSHLVSNGSTTPAVSTRAAGNPNPTLTRPNLAGRPPAGPLDSFSISYTFFSLILGTFRVMPAVSTNSGRLILAASHEQPKPPARRSPRPSSRDSACAFAELQPPTAPSDVRTRLLPALSTTTTSFTVPPQSAPIQPVTPPRRRFPGQPSRVVAQEFAGLRSPTAPPMDATSTNAELTTRSRASPTPLSRTTNANAFRHLFSSSTPTTTHSTNSACLRHDGRHGWEKTHSDSSLPVLRSSRIRRRIATYGSMELCTPAKRSDAYIGVHIPTLPFIPLPAIPSQPPTPNYATHPRYAIKPDSSSQLFPPPPLHSVPDDLAHRARRYEYVFDLEAQEWYPAVDRFADVRLAASSEEELWCPVGAWEDFQEMIGLRIGKFDGDDGHVNGWEDTGEDIGLRGVVLKDRVCGDPRGMGMLQPDLVSVYNIPLPPSPPPTPYSTAADLIAEALAIPYTSRSTITPLHSPSSTVDSLRTPVHSVYDPFPNIDADSYSSAQKSYQKTFVTIDNLIAAEGVHDMNDIHPLRFREILRLGGISSELLDFVAPITSLGDFITPIILGDSPTSDFTPIYVQCIGV